jgi:hypothetical protein
VTIPFIWKLKALAFLFNRIRARWRARKERKLAIDLGTRTSTNALVGGGLFAQIYVQLVQLIPGESAAEVLLLQPESIAFAAVLFAAAVARVSKTPEQPGKL